MAFRIRTLLKSEAVHEVVCSEVVYDGCRISRIQTERASGFVEGFLEVHQSLVARGGLLGERTLKDVADILRQVGAQSRNRLEPFVAKHRVQLHCCSVLSHATLREQFP
jgi:hypothetical protein